MKPPVVIRLKSLVSIKSELSRLAKESPPAPRHVPAEKPNPLAVAQFWLGPRLSERMLPDGSLGSFLDGTPSDLTRTMRETNRLLKADGRAQIVVNPSWRV